jgi:lysozyme
MPVLIPEQHQKKAAWITLCVACVAGFEGLRTSTYFDVGGIPTVCFGETKNIKVGDKFTPEQCKNMLGDRLIRDFGPGVDKCVHHPLPPPRKAAYTSFAYNVGIKAFCGSTAARKENAGDIEGACNALMSWNKIRVAGVMVYSPGLNNRREEERQLCLTKE